MARINNLDIPDIVLIAPDKIHDSRGYFSEIYNAQALAEAGVRETFVQDNLSLSAKAGTVRGLHFQRPPHAQAKLIRVSRGRAFDVAVDLRPTSPSFGHHAAVELSAENGLQVYIPHGFAHGFCTLEPDTEVVYKVSAYYAPQAEGGVLWSDPDLKIDWPVDIRSAIVSEKDVRLPLLKDMSQAF
ncbi:dTDP-4-dehydrorhamnose 3,5-epimerase [Hyphomicrobium sp.]|uniref:dTDP-4-dehydrorhamnose 3,5-epimerase n=1 Tax=Hyphomicrobium sp. TaxID=82 RepID=UPI0035676C74